MQGLTNQQIPAGAVNIVDPVQVYSSPLSAQQLVNLSFEHYMIHAGRVFTFSYYDAAVAGNATIYMALETGNSLVHLSAVYRNSQDFKWERRTGFAYNADGSVVTPANLRLDLAGNPLYASLANARSGMTVTVPGTAAVTRYLPSGGKGVGSQVSELAIETVFNKNTDYLFAYTNLSNQEAKFNLIVDFYELDLPLP